MVIEFLNRLATIEDKSKLVTSAEAARLLGVGTSTIKRWVDSGHLEAYKTLGGHRRISIHALLKISTNSDSTWNAKFPVTRQIDSVKNVAPAITVESVLLVDSDKTFLGQLSAFIRSAFPRLKVHTATDGFKAGVLVGRHKPGMVFLEISLPRISGIEVCRMIKHDMDLTSIRVVGITSSQNKRMLNTLKEVGAETIMCKPLEFNRINRLIDSTFYGLKVQELMN